MTTKVITLHLSPAVTPFFDLYPKLANYLTLVSAALSQGSVVVGVAYATQHGAASTLISTATSQLTSVQLEYLSGLGYTTPTSTQANQADVANSVMSAWDKAASFFLHGNKTSGASAEVTLLTRLHQFDAALQGKGKPAVTPDQ